MVKKKFQFSDDDAKLVVNSEVFVATSEEYGTLKSVKNGMCLTKEVFEYISTKRADHKNDMKSFFSDASAELEKTTKMLQFSMLNMVQKCCSNRLELWVWNLN